MTHHSSLQSLNYNNTAHIFYQGVKVTHFFSWILPKIFLKLLDFTKLISTCDIPTIEWNTEVNLLVGLGSLFSQVIWSEESRATKKASTGKSSCLLAHPLDIKMLICC